MARTTVQSQPNLSSVGEKIALTLNPIRVYHVTRPSAPGGILQSVAESCEYEEDDNDRVRRVKA